jgi:hypothetical protein
MASVSKMAGELSVTQLWKTPNLKENDRAMESQPSSINYQVSQCKVLSFYHFTATVDVIKPNLCMFWFENRENWIRFKIPQNVPQS